MQALQFRVCQAFTPVLARYAPYAGLPATARHRHIDQQTANQKALSTIHLKYDATAAGVRSGSTT